MKLKCVFISTLMALFTFSSAIFSSNIGIKAGLSFANFKTSKPLTVDLGSIGEYAVDLKNLSSWQAGAFISLRMFGGFSLQPEVYYVTRGIKIDQTILGSSFTGKVELKYVEVPLLLKYNLALESSLNPVLYAGPYIALNLKAEQVFEFVGQKWQEDIKDDIKNFDFGLVFGGGIENEVGSITVILDVRLSIGLTDINNTPGADIKVKNKTIILLAGIGF